MTDTNDRTADLRQQPGVCPACRGTHGMREAFCSVEWKDMAEAQKGTGQQPARTDCYGTELPPMRESDGELYAQQQIALQYYYRVDACHAPTSSDAACICWHDEGTGPLASDSDLAMEWRNKPAQPESGEAARYRCEPTGHGFWSHCVRAGDGTRELLTGHRKQMELAAAKLNEAFEDGKFVLQSSLTAAQ